ncbi:hypothetical protein M2333_002643 [Sphingobium sp. B11D3B]|uniref:hypothetical protein n=1 Tax=Sphingobium sp. B11D3B TaxID=2940575 RepID=UPI0022279AA8|nr:hypothetical protein [Sphingobium sp. B11D3B]MCW2389597.1 hypothetical protein [Sphingobium sp. B11D3B]
MQGMTYAIRGGFKALLLTWAAILFVWRVLAAYDHVRRGDPDLLLAFPLAVIFPALLVLLLSLMPAARSREGVLMRIGTMVQLCLIVMLPPVALYLALGLPVVFLVVELFETRVPAAIRDPLVRMAVR